MRSYFSTFTRYVVLAGCTPVGFGLMLMTPRGENPNVANIVAGGGLLIGVAIHVVKTLWLKKC